MKKNIKVLLAVSLLVLLMTSGCMASHYGQSSGRNQHSSGCH